jgi:hypothetical protein
MKLPRSGGDRPGQLDPLAWRHRALVFVDARLLAQHVLAYRPIRAISHTRIIARDRSPTLIENAGQLRLAY